MIELKLLIKIAESTVMVGSTRKGRNPRTGEEIEISARKVLAFKPSKELVKKG